MIVEQYGLIYSRVTEQDLETLRYWRNQSFIRDTMQFKDYITPTMQKNWFQKLIINTIIILLYIIIIKK